MKPLTILGGFLLLFAVCLPSMAWADEAVGHVVLVSGVARSEAEEITHILRNGSPVHSGETLRTAEGSYLSLLFVDGARVLMRPNSVFVVEDYRYTTDSAQPSAAPPRSAEVVSKPTGNGALLRFIKGGFRVVSGLIGKINREDYRIFTPIATVGIRGTDIRIDVTEDSTSTIAVSEGAVDVANLLLPEQIVRVNAGYFTIVRPLLPPDAVQANDTSEPGNGGGLGALERAEDSLVESAELPAADRYLAFANPVFDVLANPAYVTASQGRSGIFSLAGSSYGSSQDFSLAGQAGTASKYSGEGIASQLVSLNQHSAHNWFGVTASAIAARSDAPDAAALSDTSTTAPSQLQGDAANGSIGLLAARQMGRWGLGLGGNFYRSHLRTEEIPASGPDPSVITRSDNRITEVQVGGVRDPSTTQTLAIGFIQQFIESDARTSTSLHKDLSGTGQVFELRWRQPMQSQLFLGTLLRVQQSDTSEQVDDANVPVYAENIRVHAFHTGVGLGFVPTASTAFVADLTLGYTRERALQRQTDGRVREDEHDKRLSAALHLGSQLHLPYHLLVALDATQQFVREDKRFLRLPDTVDERTDTTRDTRNDLQMRASIAYGKGGYLLGYLAASGSAPEQPVVHNLFLIVSW